MYDFYTSIGENCEVAFQIRRVLGFDDSSFFSWNITPILAFSRLVDDEFSGIMEPSKMSFHNEALVMDGRYGYMFHTMFPAGQDIVFDDYPEVVSQHREKARYLIDKLYENARSAQRVLYVYKCSGLLEGDLAGAPSDKAMEIAKRLRRIHADRDNFDLVFVQDAAHREEDWGLPNVKNRYLTRLASFADATDGHVQSWDRIFAEFPHVKPLRLAGF